MPQMIVKTGITEFGCKIPIGQLPFWDPTVRLNGSVNEANVIHEEWHEFQNPWELVP